MSFPRNEVSKLLAACHRRCCICHKFCGVKMETDHIVPESEEGADDIENAIPVCFECHAEIKLYNDKHPKGRKFTPEELILHKGQWLDICKNYPEVLVETPRLSDPGPLQGLVDEVQFNAAISKTSASGNLGCPFKIDKFDFCISDGIFSLLPDEVRDTLTKAYIQMKKANTYTSRIASIEPEGNAYAQARNEASEEMRKASEPIEAAKRELEDFLGYSES